MKLKTFKLAAVIGFALAGTILSHGSASAAATCGLANGQAAKGEPILIGAVVGKTGPDDFSSPAKSVQAYFNCINANGGINGRPLKYLVEDDQWNPEVASQVAAKLVTDEKVLAMVGNSSFVECAANASFYEKSNVVSFSGAGVPRECFTAKNIAAYNAGPRQSLVQTAQYAHYQLGAKSMTCISLNIPGMGDWACGGVEAWAKSQGLTAKTILVDPGSADATSTLIQAAADKPDAILIGFAKGLAVAFLNAAEQQDLAATTKFVIAGGGYNAEVPAAVGAYWNDRAFINLELNLLESEGPDNKNWQAIMEEYGQKDDPRDTFSQAGYLAAKAATDALLKLDPAKIDRDSASSALREVKGIKSDILCDDWYFGKDATRHNAVHTTRMAALTDGKFKVVQDCTASEDPDLADLKELEASLK